LDEVDIAAQRWQRKRTRY